MRWLSVALILGVVAPACATGTLDELSGGAPAVKNPPVKVPPADAGPRPDGSTPGNDTGTLPPPAPCSNGVIDAPETDVDCGGGTCAKCGAGKKCSVAADCEGGSCLASTCQT